MARNFDPYVTYVYATVCFYETNGGEGKSRGKHESMMIILNEWKFRGTHIEDIRRCNSLSLTLNLFRYKHVRQLLARSTELSWHTITE